MFQYRVYPIDPITGDPTIAPELCPWFVVADRKQATKRADQIALSYGWLDRGVREECRVSGGEYLDPTDDPTWY